MKNLLIATIISLICFSCTVSPLMYKAKKIRNGSDYNVCEFHTKIEYRNFDEAIAEYEYLAREQMWDSTKLQNKINRVKIGGEVSLKVVDKYMRYGNTGTYIYIVSDTAGNELMRGSFEDQIPHNRYGFFRRIKWYSKSFGGIDSNLPTIFQIQILNTVNLQKHNYKVKLKNKYRVR